MAGKEAHQRKAYVNPDLCLDGVSVPDKSNLLTHTDINGYENDAFREGDIQSQCSSRSRYNGGSISHSKSSSPVRPDATSPTSRLKEKRKPPPLDLTGISNLVIDIELDTNVNFKPSRISGNGPTEQTTLRSTVIHIPVSEAHNKDDSGPKLVGNRTTIKHMVRSLNGQQHSYHVTDDTKEAERPQSHFCLSLFTCFCCLSPFGFVAIILAGKQMKICLIKN